MLKLISTVTFLSIIFVLGFIQEAEAADMTFSGVHSFPLGATIAAGDTWTIDPGATVTIGPGYNLENRGTLINNGNLILTGDGTFQTGTIQNRDSGIITNSGTINLVGGGGQGTGSIFNLEIAKFTNSGTITITGGPGTFSGSLRVGGTSTFTNTNTITITGDSGIQSGYIGVIRSSVFTNTGSIDITAGSGHGSGLFDNWDNGSIINSGSVTVSGNIGTNSGHVTNMGSSIFKNNGVLTITGGNGINTGVMINNDNANFENTNTIIIIIGGPASDSRLKIGGTSVFTNHGTIITDKNFINLASLTNFQTISIGNDLDNQGKTINNCGTITIIGIVIGNKILESKCAGDSKSHEDPTIGVTSWGFQVVENGICIDIRCWTVTADFHQDFELVEMLSDSTHTISTTVYCHNGVSKCNYVAFGVSPYGTNINDSVWKVILQKDHNDNWSMTVIDPDGYLGDVTSTTQIVNDEKNLAVSITALFKKPTPGMILNVETRDSYGGYRDFQFNDGIAIKDAYAYPLVELSYEAPLELEPLCLNENPNKRYTCAFDKVREWTVKNAELKLQQIIDK